MGWCSGTSGLKEDEHSLIDVSLWPSGLGGQAVDVYRCLNQMPVHPNQPELSSLLPREPLSWLPLFVQ